jgi:hypothetical protein
MYEVLIPVDKLIPTTKYWIRASFDGSVSITILIYHSLNRLDQT